jgi:hypothetical protein
MKTTIAVNLGHKFVAIEAEIIEVLGFTIGIHKTVNSNGWTGTHTGTGIAFCSRRKNRLDCIERVTDLITRRGVDKVREQIQKLAPTPAPAVETLEAHVVKVKAPAAKADIPAIVAAINNTVPLSDREKAAVVTALNSRTGQLKAKSPSAFDGDGLACAAWQGLQPNAFKVSVGACLFLHGESRDLFERLSKVRWPAALDKDKAALVALGAW